MDEQDRSGGSLKLNVAETINSAQSRLRNAPLRRAVDSTDVTPSATSVKAGHDEEPPTPAKGDDGKDDNAQANQDRLAGFGMCFKMRGMAANVPAFDQSHSIRE